MARVTEAVPAAAQLGNLTVVTVSALAVLAVTNPTGFSEFNLLLAHLPVRGYRHGPGTVPAGIKFNVEPGTTSTAPYRTVNGAEESASGLPRWRLRCGIGPATGTFQDENESPGRCPWENDRS